MFSIQHITENGFKKILLQDDVSKTSASIIPACGAILHTFNIQLNNTILNVIDSYESLEDFNKNVTAKGFKGTKLSPFACRMRNGEYEFGKSNHRIEKFYLGANAIHGLLYDAAFELVDASASETNAMVTMSHAYRAEDSGYPFQYDCIVTYLLEENNRLSITTVVMNKSDGLIPIQDGWHPYFTFGGSIDNLLLEFQSSELLEFDSELIPTGRLSAYHDFNVLKKIGPVFFDNCFLLNFKTCQPLLVLRDPTLSVQLEIYPDPSYPYLQIYTPDHRKSIAIENLSAAPDAFNNNMGTNIIQPGESASFTTAFKITNLALP